MGVMAEIADRMMVMYAGRVVERGSKRDLFLDAAASLYARPARLHPAAERGKARIGCAQFQASPPIAAQPPARLRLCAALPAALREMRAASPH